MRRRDPLPVRPAFRVAAQSSAVLLRAGRQWAPATGRATIQCRSNTAFVTYYNRHSYHDSLKNPSLADVYFGRGQTILLERERTKRKAIEHRRLQHRKSAA